ncbi:carboxymuconolactone decarboxylase family protein [Bdellovibrio svalbardensis]|uniref:Carboxymuconolactone decarboxylase family protein n=1 Tax=Bdellovibrio svalbardensis TaxID=2972972 RepID=A0ABT6DMR9_9BACT|nr:carboxymuconolactone decarboxylase family protein [Bdellovibrio svalbardensis]MDG0818170.1 carboxymuconolactone decarboxylase family protein [Bdellovibrio svalbardensis]
MAIDKQPVGKEVKPMGPSVQRPPSKWKAVDEALEEMRNAFGAVPDFVMNMTDESIPGAWAEAKNLYFNPNTALELKLKNLIGLGVSAQIPCELLGYFEQVGSLNNGATPQEQAEAVAMAAMTRHWSTVLNGSQMDKEAFKKEAEQIMSYVKQMMDKSGGKPPAAEAFMVKFSTAAETYKDIEKTLGIIPKFFLNFPEEGISGAWSEFKAVQLNPHTSLTGKQKELIGVAVAAQIPCDYCITFHRLACKLNGATDREIQEAISIASMGRHWSTLFHGMQLNLATFKKDADQMLKKSGERRLTS